MLPRRVKRRLQLSHPFGEPIDFFTGARLRLPLQFLQPPTTELPVLGYHLFSGAQ